MNEWKVRLSGVPSKGKKFMFLRNTILMDQDFPYVTDTFLINVPVEREFYRVSIPAPEHK